MQITGPQVDAIGGRGLLVVVQSVNELVSKLQMWELKNIPLELQLRQAACTHKAYKIHDNMISNSSASSL